MAPCSEGLHPAARAWRPVRKRGPGDRFRPAPPRTRCQAGQLALCPARQPSPARLPSTDSPTAAMSLAPPFTLQTATRKVKIAQALWNTRDFKKVAAAYTPDSCWRNRAEFATGTAQIEDLLRRKWEREHDYVLRKEVRSGRPVEGGSSSPRVPELTCLLPLPPRLPHPSPPTALCVRHRQHRRPALVRGPHCRDVRLDPVLRPRALGL